MHNIKRISLSSRSKIYSSQQLIILCFTRISAIYQLYVNIRNNPWEKERKKENISKIGPKYVSHVGHISSEQSYRHAMHQGYMQNANENLLRTFFEMRGIAYSVYPQIGEGKQKGWERSRMAPREHLERVVSKMRVQLRDKTPQVCVTRVFPRKTKKNSGTRERFPSEAL